MDVIRQRATSEATVKGILSMMNRYSNLNQYSKWLLNSGPGETAVAPCVTHDICMHRIRETVLECQALITLRSNISRLTIDAHGRGSIEFIKMDLERLSGRVWNHAFDIDGDFHKVNFYPKFKVILATRIRAKVTQ